jgi:RimJ/RimL family protein N-acetyltransferase
MTIDLGCCVLRPYRLDDTEAYTRNANDRDVWINLRDRFPHPYTCADAQHWITYVLTSATDNNFAIDVDGEAVGAIGLAPQEDVYRRSAEIGFWLGKKYWGRGIATAAVRTLTDLAFTDGNLCRIFAHVFEWNPASMCVLEKSGYQMEGRLRKAILKDGIMGDVLIYARIV